MESDPTRLNPHYDDCYFSINDGLKESRYIFIEGNSLPEKMKSHETWHIGETGFGTGLNLMALMLSLADKHEMKIQFHSVEKYPLSPERIKALCQGFNKELGPILNHYLSFWEELFPRLQKGSNTGIITGSFGQIELNYYWGDVIEWMEETPFTVDAWFLDGHSPDKNPDMWSPELFKQLAQHSHEGSSLATFTAAGLVKQGLRNQNFFIKRKKGFAGKRHMIQGHYLGNT